MVPRPIRHRRRIWQKPSPGALLAEAFLGDFDHLPLPDVSSLSLLGFPDTSGPKPQVRLLGSDEIRLAQDACVAKWPPYEQVRAQLRQELQVALDIDAMDVNALATGGLP